MNKIILRFFVLLLVITGFLIGVLIVNSSKTTDGFPNHRGIAEVRDIRINGVQQRVLIRGADKSNPLLLHVHGGPGFPDQAIMQSRGKTLEDLFTVIYWDQRGSGASYNKSSKLHPPTIENIVSDGLELSSMLLDEFDHEKLYLQGHSWGTLVAVHMVSRAPELFTAFFGIGQFADGKRSEKLSWNYAVSAATNAGDQSSVNKLLALGSPPYKTEQEWLYKIPQQRTLMRPYENPDQPPQFTEADYYKMAFFYNGYGVVEKLNFLNGLQFSLTNLWPSVIESNLIESHTRLEVPVYIFQGKYDQHTVTAVAKDYYQALSAPKKAYYEFEHSAHEPHINEYDKYRKLVKDVLQANAKITTHD